MDIPINPVETSAENRLSAVLIVERSENRLESLACLSNSPGLRAIMTTTLKIATRARTTRSSIKVKDALFLFCRFIRKISIYS